MGAVQAQESTGAESWSAGLRVAGGTDAGVERAVAAFEIVRSWPMRGTLHLVAAADLRWMLRLLTPRVVRGFASRYRQLELDESVLMRARRVIVKCIGGQAGGDPARIGALLRENAIETRENRGGHIMAHLAQEAQLFSDRTRASRRRSCWSRGVGAAGANARRREAIVELTRRYFQPRPCDDPGLAGGRG